jgi:uncharacterized protein with HEPN domain
MAFRNIALHEYFAVDWSIGWVAATQDPPKLRTDVELILAAEFVEPENAIAEND